MAKETANNGNGWICLHRSFKDWQHYGEPSVMVVFIDLLLSVNAKDGWWHGHKCERGATFRSIRTIAENTTLNPITIRKALAKLELTGEIKRIKIDQKHTKTIICNFAKYQGVSGASVLKSNTQSNTQSNTKQQYNNNNNIVVVEYNAHARTREAVVNDFFSGGISVESFCLNNHVTVEQCRSIAEAVVTEWELTGELTAHATLSDERKHLIAQMRIKADALRAKGQLLSEPFEVRRKRFIAECKELIAQGFAKAEVADFFAYYSQKEQGGERMLFETYKGWDTQTRFLLKRKAQ